MTSVYMYENFKEETKESQKKKKPLKLKTGSRPAKVKVQKQNHRGTRPPGSL